MPPRRLFLSLLICVVVFLASCAGTPMRNLASDAAMIKSGKTTSQDLARMIGEPDERKPGDAGREIWVYREKETSRLKTAPLIGRLFNPRKEEMLTIDIRDGVVFSARYGAVGHDPKPWSDDFDWQGDEK
ncbi:MAG: hypothetical protein LBU39_12000 [Desulfobulbaceae bacterium]|jgi:hypothetical protein|nr:hypothetical protein [Desulfobulbaceae bacterium]